MAEIKAATRRQHVALEAHAGILERVETPRGYAAMIMTFALLHEVYEPQIAVFDAEFRRFGFLLAQRSKRALLAQDGVRIWDRFAIDTRGAHAGDVVMPHVGTPAQAVGWLYVFEGSTLGGTTIALHARRALNITTSYYGAYGAQTAAMWRDFGAFVRAYVDHERGVLPAVIDGARTAYTLVTALLNAEAPVG